MGIKLSDLARNERAISVFFCGGMLNLKYRPSAFNAALEAEDRDYRQQGLPLLALATQLERALVAWELTDDDDRPLPISRETLSQLGVDVLAAIHSAIVEDLAPNRRSG